MGDQWVEFKKQPGIYYRFSEDGKLELLGSNLGSLADWTAIAEEVRREWFLAKQSRRKRNQAPAEDQLDLFPLRGIGSRRLEEIPVLRRNRRSA